MERFTRLFGLDLSLTSLALLRIVVASLVLLDLGLRLGDLESFYTDQGVFPRVVFLQSPHTTFLSLYLMAGTGWGVAGLLLLTSICAAALLVGYRTRVVAVGTWVLLQALKTRNPLILDGGDLELTLVLFWGFFLPWNARYSVDAKRNPQWNSLPEQFSSPATFAYAFQIAILYFMAGLCKTDPVWRESGLALYYVFNIDQFSTDVAKWALGFPETLKYLTFTALAVEFLIPLLIFWPWWRERVRCAAWILILSLHIGILLTIHLGIMPIINIGCAVALWPASWSCWLLSKFLGRESDNQTASKSSLSLPSGYRLSPVARALVIACGLYVGYINWATSIATTHISPMPVKVFGYLVQLYQDWFLFAPAPMSEDGWYVLEGEMEDGQHIDLLKNRPLDFSKPPSVANDFKNHRWRRWMQNMEMRRDARVFESYCYWVASHWNHERQTNRVLSMKFFFVSEPTPLPQQHFTTAPVVLFEYRVPDKLRRDPRNVRIP